MLHALAEDPEVLRAKRLGLRALQMDLYARNLEASSEEGPSGGAKAESSGPGYGVQAEHRPPGSIYLSHAPCCASVPTSTVMLPHQRSEPVAAVSLSAPSHMIFTRSALRCPGVQALQRLLGKPYLWKQQLYRPPASEDFDSSFRLDRRALGLPE